MTSRSANRHLRPNSTGEQSDRLQLGPCTVRVTGDTSYLSTAAGQHLAQMTVNLLARQYDVTKEIYIDVPQVPVASHVFPGCPPTSNLSTALLEWGKRIAGPEIRVLEHNLRAAPGAIIYIGAGNAGGTDLVINVTADGWRLQCSTEKRVVDANSTDTNPHGPYLAACFAAGAIFRYFIGGDPRTDLCASLWDYKQGPWDALAVGRAPSGLSLPTTYLVGAGAVGAGLAFTLAATPNISGDLIIIDPQRTEETNRNRLLSMHYDQVDRDKASLAYDLFRYTNIRAYPYVGRWPDYTADSQRRTPAPIREVERTYRYEWVLSCVDRNAHRQAIATYIPKVSIGGSTLDLTAQAAAYSMRGECECLACNHPLPHLLSTEDLTQKLASKTQQERRQWYDGHDASPQQRAAIEEFLVAPTCGSIGEQALIALGREGPTDWAVGFVSVAAAVMQSATYLRGVANGMNAILTDGSERFAWFGKANLGRSYARRNPTCDVCTSSKAQARYDGLWNHV